MSKLDKARHWSLALGIILFELGVVMTALSSAELYYPVAYNGRYFNASITILLSGLCLLVLSIPHLKTEIHEIARAW